jgi:hypothetical protein
MRQVKLSDLISAHLKTLEWRVWKIKIHGILGLDRSNPPRVVDQTSELLAHFPVVVHGSIVVLAEHQEVNHIRMLK